MSKDPKYQLEAALNEAVKRELMTYLLQELTSEQITQQDFETIRLFLHRSLHG